MIDLLRISSEVREALDSSRPVVALETTILSHGFPYPENRDLAQDLDAAIREEGAVPATIGLLDGHIHIGLQGSALEPFFTAKHAEKVSRRNLAAVLARRTIGATTVAATMWCASVAGIRVFATGGLGGVHRGAQQTMDISADLTELARTPVLVVCAGAKAILDLRLTLEYLETQGVPVIGYQTDRFPAFYTAESGLPVSARADSPAELANIANLHWQLGGGGLVAAVPIPAAAALATEEVDTTIEQAIAEAAQQKIQGSAWTPYVLDRLRQATSGRTVTANHALALNNARVAARVAGELTALARNAARGQ